MVMKRLILLAGSFACLTASFAAAMSTHDRIVYPEAGSTEGTSTQVLDFAAAHRYGQGFTRDGDEIECDNGADSKVMRGAQWRVDLDQKAAMPFTVTAESKSFSDGGSLGSNYSLYLDISYQDGTKLYGQHEAFLSDSRAGWQRKTVVVSPVKPVKSFACFLLYRHVAGKVRFRRPKVCRYAGSKFCLYDSCIVDLGRCRNMARPGFLIRDAASHRGFLSIESGGCAENVCLEARESRLGSAASLFDVVVSDLSGQDRAVTLVYAVPIDGNAPLVWHNDPRTSQELSPDKDTQMRETERYDIGEGGLSRWPFGAVTSGRRAEALGIDGSAPAFFRVTAHAPLRQIFISFDLGLTREKKSAHFRFVRFAFPARHGFRGAFASYQALFPEMFKVRIREHGLWMPFRRISTVEGWEDFGFKVKEGDNETGWDDAHGILTFHYTEPSTWWMSMPKNLASYSFEDGLREAHRLSDAGDASALAWRRSAFLDEAGRVVGSVQDTPWCKGMVWNLCPLPGIKGGNFENNFRREAWELRYAGKSFPDGVDGEYIDSAEGYLTANMDFDRGHFACSKTPLAYARASKRPGLAKPLMMYEYVRETSDRCHAMGRLLMGNAIPVRWPWLVMYSDYSGQEINWINRKTGAWKPADESVLLYRRAMSGAKPYCFLMNADFDRFSPEMVEKYMQRTLAYGIFPGFFSPNASRGHYFSRPELYNRDRPLFKKYIPLCRMISEAGWRPLNWLLSSDNPNIAVEQFGDRFVTVFNGSGSSQTVRLKAAAGKPRAHEHVTGQKWRFTDRDLSVVLPPETVRLLEFQ